MVWENLKISVKYGGHFVKILGENRGNEACTVGEIATLAWQH